MAELETIELTRSEIETLQNAEDTVTKERGERDPITFYHIEDDIPTGPNPACSNMWNELLEESETLTWNQYGVKVTHAEEDEVSDADITLTPKQHRELAGNPIEVDGTTITIYTPVERAIDAMKKVYDGDVTEMIDDIYACDNDTYLVVELADGVQFTHELIVAMEEAGFTVALYRYNGGIDSTSKSRRAS